MFITQRLFVEVLCAAFQMEDLKCLAVKASNTQRTQRIIYGVNDGLIPGSHLSFMKDPSAIFAFGVPEQRKISPLKQVS